MSVEFFQTHTPRRLPIGRLTSLAAAALVVISTCTMSLAADAPPLVTIDESRVTFNTMKIDGVDVFYREAGRKDAPAVLLLHGFPTSSHMYRNLIPALADRFHVVAPDYPGFGHSGTPRTTEFDYTFDHLTDVVDKLVQQLHLSSYSIYLQDYGAPVGFRLAVRHPERVRALIVQNGNAYEEGLRDFWTPLRAYWKDPGEATSAPLKPFLTLAATKWQYTHGTRQPDGQNPDTWTLDQTFLDRPGNQEIQLRLFLDYGSNPGHYPEWQAYFRKYQPPMLIVWGKNDQIFPVEGATPYSRDLKSVETHLLDTGHFALEEDGVKIALLIRDFLDRSVSSPLRKTATGSKR